MQEDEISNKTERERERENEERGISGGVWEEGETTRKPQEAGCQRAQAYILPFALWSARGESNPVCKSGCKAYSYTPCGARTHDLWLIRPSL